MSLIIQYMCKICPPFISGFEEKLRIGGREESRNVQRRLRNTLQTYNPKE